MNIAKAIGCAWADPAYKSKLVSDPHAALAEAGVDVPAGVTLKVVEDTADTKHVVLPTAPANAASLTEEDLNKVAGGGSCGASAAE